MGDRVQVGGSAMKNKGQGLLESVVALVCTTLLIGGILQFWLWSNAQLVKRQLFYNKTRVEAGTAGIETVTYAPQWPAGLLGGESLAHRDDPLEEYTVYDPFPQGGE